MRHAHKSRHGARWLGTGTMKTCKRIARKITEWIIFNPELVYSGIALYAILMFIGIAFFIGK